MLYFSLIVIQIIFFDAHFLLYRTVRDIFGVTGETLFVLKIIAIALSLSFIIASLLSHLFCNKITKIIYRSASVWLGFLIYFLLAATAYWIVFFSFGKLVSLETLIRIGELFFAVAALVGIYGLINANNIRIKRITISIPNLPASWKKRKILLISDVHLGQVKGKSFAEKITNLARSLSPDIVFFAGDMFDGVKVDADECVAPFSKINAPLGSFFVIGNHEEFRKNSAKIYADAIQKAGITVLDNKSTLVDGVEIIGVTDSDAINKKTYETTLTRIIGTDKKYPRILLKHTPVSSAVAEKLNVDVELSGHTHAGQVFPFNIITPFLFKERNYGLSKFGKMTVYTSSGAGTAVTPMRVGTNPEVILISFENKS